MTSFAETCCKSKPGSARSTAAGLAESQEDYNLWRVVKRTLASLLCSSEAPARYCADTGKPYMYRELNNQICRL